MLMLLFRLGHRVESFYRGRQAVPDVWTRTTEERWHVAAGGLRPLVPGGFRHGRVKSKMSPEQPTTAWLPETALQVEGIARPRYRTKAYRLSAGPKRQ